MAHYAVKLKGTLEVSTIIYVQDGDDWDGRPVEDQFDASSLAYDIAVDEGIDNYDYSRRDIDWQVDYVEVFNGKS